MNDQQVLFHSETSASLHSAVGIWCRDTFEPVDKTDSKLDFSQGRPRILTCVFTSLCYCFAHCSANSCLICAIYMYLCIRGMYYPGIYSNNKLTNHARLCYRCEMQANGVLYWKGLNSFRCVQLGLPLLLGRSSNQTFGITNDKNFTVRDPQFTIHGRLGYDSKAYSVCLDPHFVPLLQDTSASVFGDNVTLESGEVATCLMREHRVGFDLRSGHSGQINWVPPLETCRRMWFYSIILVNLSFIGLIIENTNLSSSNY